MVDVPAQESIIQRVDWMFPSWIQEKKTRFTLLTCKNPVKHTYQQMAKQQQQLEVALITVEKTSCAHIGEDAVTPNIYKDFCVMDFCHEEICGNIS